MFASIADCCFFSDSLPPLFIGIRSLEEYSLSSKFFHMRASQILELLSFWFHLWLCVSRKKLTTRNPDVRDSSCLLNRVGEWGQNEEHTRGLSTSGSRKPGLWGWIMESGKEGGTGNISERKLCAHVCTILYIVLLLLSSMLFIIHMLI